MFFSSPPSHPLLLASIGNPRPYKTTLHSAGHLVLEALHTRLPQPFSPFSPDRAYPKGVISRPEKRPGPQYNPLHGLLGSGVGEKEGEEKKLEVRRLDDPFLLWQSGLLMNVSGEGVSAAWRGFKREVGADKSPAPILVVLHDELEKPLGSLTVRDGLLSPKGHNGLKSIAKHLPGEKYVRIGIGIGRPKSRDPEEVSRYVLRKCTDREYQVLVGKEIGLGVLEKVREIGTGKVPWK
ncbi:peptidyl-tRNA hydrolase [Aulographum hederae CBS 113979]|uniref:peptidyl-tRNA hydrolase n=1 Tax=Aulographum hederae CBS 113979 TaxID=1176131 RepID=A0A6G1GJ95_9PEZI|nr:peptidyl-tRNA hydrolase [Aulographum hederae CBS 113979]